MAQAGGEPREGKGGGEGGLGYASGSKVGVEREGLVAGRLVEGLSTRQSLIRPTE